MRCESEKTRNRKMVLTALQLLLGLLFAPAAAFPATVTLGWDPSDTPDIAGYKVYYQANSPDLPFQGGGAAEGGAPVDVAQNLTATLSDLDPANSYFFAVTAYDAAGVESPYSNVIEKPEALPPTVAITSPVNGSAVSGEVAVAAAASDNKGVARVEFYVNGALKGSVAAAPFSYAWDTSMLPGGEYTLSAKAFDAAGNAGEAAVTVSVTGDAVPPLISLTQPLNNSAVSGTVNITANASDNVALSRIEFYADDALIFGSNQSPASYGWNTLGVANGNHVVAVKGYDAAGNMGESVVVLQVVNDRVAPEAVLTSPAPGTALGSATAAGTVVEVTATASDDIAVSRVEFYLNGALEQSVALPPYRFTWDSATVSSGTYTLSAMVYDASGKAGLSPAVAVTVSHDTTPPAASITAPSAGSTVTGQVSVVAAASDNLSLKKVELYLDGALKGSFTAQPYSLTLDTRQLANGGHVLSARAYDAAGNLGESSSVTVNVFNDLFAPGITSFSMPAADNSATVEVLSFTAMDNVGVTGYLITESATVPSLDAAWSAAAPTSFTFSATGKRTAYAWARDAAGHISAASTAVVTVDTVLPVISSMVFVNGADSVILNASGTDNVAVGKMELYLDDVLQLETEQSSLSYVCSPTYSKGQRVTLKVYDTAGNMRSRTLRVAKY